MASRKQLVANSASGNGSRGFGLFGVLLVIAATAILAGGGYFAYQRFTEEPESPESGGIGRPCGPLEDRECTADIVFMCSPDGKEQKDAASNCSCGEDARSLAAQGWKACPGEPSAIDTSTWKTYRNEQYGFEVRYPQNFIISAGSNVDYNERGEVERVTQIPPYPETPGAWMVYVIDDKNHIFSENPAPVTIVKYVPFVTEPKFASIIENERVQTNLENILRIGYESFKNKQAYRLYWKPDTTNVWQFDRILINHKGKTLSIFYRTDKKIFYDIVESLKFLE